MSDLLPRIRLFGLDVRSCTLDEAADQIVRDADQGETGYVVTANADHLVQLRDNAEFRAAYAGARYVFADGAPLVLVSKLSRGESLPGRVTGADLLPAVAARAAKSGIGLYFLGGEEGVADQASQRLAEQNPGLIVAGTYSPPRGFERSEAETSTILRKIHESGAKIVFVGVGAPKQELWVAKNMDSLVGRIVLCTGGAFDFVAGRIKRAPRAVQAVGMEWAWRLASEPGRMWRRYLVRDVAFIPMALREIRRRGR